MSGCKPDVENSLIPDYRVYLKVKYSDYVQLLNVGTFKTYTEHSDVYPINTFLGYGGLIVFRDFDGKLGCCDLACPYCYDLERTQHLLTVNTSLLATCHHCNTVYDLQWGLCVPIEGPSKVKLKIYPHCKDTGSSIIVSY